jgi:hypothetical protein
MNKSYLTSNILAILSLLIISCSNSRTPTNTQNTNSNGTLNLVANGEDFVRQGFITKDGWQINFDRLDVNLSNITAYQVEGGFDAQQEQKMENLASQPKVTLLTEPQVVDLAQGEADAKPIIITTTPVPSGLYNAIAWQIDTAPENSPLAGKTMVLQGTATKEQQEINFNISLNRPIKYLCGEYIGEERKGIISAGEAGELEITFHFDHLFGDSETSADDDLNLNALGFEPLAKLAYGDRLTIDDPSLFQQLSPQDQEKLTQAIIGLGHVGEGHCQLIQENRS